MPITYLSILLRFLGFVLDKKLQRNASKLDILLELKNTTIVFFPLFYLFWAKHLNKSKVALFGKWKNYFRFSIANFEAFLWRFSSSTIPVIVRYLCTLYLKVYNTWQQHFRVMIFCNYFSAPPENPRSPRKCQRPQFVRGQSEFHQSLAIPARLRCFSVCGQISRRKERWATWCCRQ